MLKSSLRLALALWGIVSFILQCATPVSLPAQMTAATTLHLDSAYAQQHDFAPLQKYLRVLEEQQGIMSIEEVMEAEQQGKFTPLSQYPLPLKRNVAYWLVLHLENHCATQPRWLLHFGENDIRATGRNSFIDAIVVENGSVQQRKYAGYHRPARERDIATLHNAVEVDIPLQRPLHVFVRLQRMYDFPANPTMRILPPQEFERPYFRARMQHFNIAFLMLGGFAIITVFYSIYGFIVRDRAFIFFVAYTFASLLIFGYLFGVFHQFLFANLPTFENYIFFFCIILGAAESLFVRSFLNLQRFSPFWSKFLLFVAVFHAIVSSAIFAHWLVWQSFPIANGILLVMLLLIIIGQLIFSARLLYIGTPLVRYVLAGNVVLYGANLLFVLVTLLPRYLGIPFPVDFSTGLYVACFGSLARICLFALGFGYRTKVMEQERASAREDLIRQLQRNEELQQSTNQMLEAKVLERTLELEQANENLVGANQEIERQLFILEEQAMDIEVRNASMHEINEELRSANEFKLKMLGIAAHDLKNPISNVLLSAQLLARKATPEAVKEYSESIRESSAQMLAIIEDLLESAALGLGKVALEIRPFNLSTAIHQAVAQFHGIVEAKKQQIEVFCPDQCLMQGDEVRIRQVLDNLLSNASKYSPLGGRITLTVRTINDYVQISVHDSGPGLTEEDKSKLFGMFQRLSAKPTAGESSSGVGLASVKNIVELHGGKIEVFSEFGQGSNFVITLPLLAGG